MSPPAAESEARRPRPCPEVAGRNNLMGILIDRHAPPALSARGGTHDDAVMVASQGLP